MSASIVFLAAALLCADGKHCSPYPDIDPGFDLNFIPPPWASCLDEDGDLICSGNYRSSPINAPPDPCEAVDQRKLQAAKEACFVDKQTTDPATMQACTRLNEADRAYWDCRAQRAVEDALGKHR